ncbi:MAG TPA: group II intron reverse transcriptase/maturase [bacterium]|nr:group II intron reverse transcriptase/maturase [bacterium]
MNKHETLALFGPPRNIVSLALKTVLKFKETAGPLLVLDFQGVGAVALNPENEMLLRKRPVVWVDTANRRKPVSFFPLSFSKDAVSVFRYFLKTVRDIAKMRLVDDTIDHVARGVERCLREGQVGPRALLTVLADRMMRGRFFDADCDSREIARCIAMLRYALRFPAVYNVSEGINRMPLREILQKRHTVWIEMPREHFEPDEHRLVAAFIQTAVLDWSLFLPTADGTEVPSLERPTVLHLFPHHSDAYDSFVDMVQPTQGWIRHIGVFGLSARPPSVAARSWARGAGQIWLLGGEAGFPREQYATILGEHAVAAAERIDGGALYIMSKEREAGISIRVRVPPVETTTAAELRVSSGVRRQVAALRQCAGALGDRGLVRPEAGEEMYERLCEKETLLNGWFKVLASNRKSTGTDGMTVPQFKEKLDHELARVSDELTTGTYRPRLLKRVSLEKPGGGVRVIGISCVRDRVVQTALLTLLEPLFEPAFSNFSFAFRPHRNAHQAIDAARSMIAMGGAWAVIADIRKCFDSLDHEVLLSLVERKIGDEKLLALIHQWLTADALDFGDIVPVDVGVPQGGSISPLLANIYLDPLDRHFERAGYNFVRYADDIVIFCKDREAAREALRDMGTFLSHTLRLELKPTKTAYVPVREGFEFLGFRMTDTEIAIQESKTDRVIHAVAEQLRIMGSDNVSLMARLRATIRLNSVVRGFRNYFRAAGGAAIHRQLTRLDELMRELAERHLPATIREDPVFRFHERFARTLPGHGDQPADGSAALREVAGIYPLKVEQKTTPGWMQERDAVENGGAAQAGETSRVVATGEDIDEGSVLVHGNRVFVLTHHGYVAMEGDVLVVRRKKKDVCAKKIEEIGLLYLQGAAMNISVPLQIRLAEKGVPVVYAPPFGKPAAVLAPVISEKANLRRQQVLRRDDPDVARTGLQMLAAKIGNQAGVISYFAKYRRKVDAAQGRRMMEVAAELRVHAARVAELTPGGTEMRAVAMGLEGRAAALYWKELAFLIPAALDFPGRVTIHAQDLFNQCLNYVYGILYGEVWRAVSRCGLDPYFGIMHGSQRDGGSLVFDLIEEFRAPFADRFVVALMGRGFLPEQDTENLLKFRCRKTLVTGFLKQWTNAPVRRCGIKSPSRLLDEQAMALTKLFEGKGSYRPFKMKW